MSDPAIISAIIVGVATVAAAVVGGVIAYRRDRKQAAIEPGKGQISSNAEPATPASQQPSGEGSFGDLVKESERLADIQTEQANRIFSTLYEVAGEGVWISCEDIAAALAGEKTPIESDVTHLQRVIDVLMRAGQLPGIARDGSRVRITEQYYTLKLQQAIAEKQEIAEAALSRIEPRSTVLLDAGSTTLRIAEGIADRVVDGRLSDICVITNSPDHLRSLLEAVNKRGLVDEECGIRLYMLGGRVRILTRAVVDDDCCSSFRESLEAMVKGLKRHSISFVGTNGVDATGGFTTQTPLEAETKRAMLDVADKCFIVTDSVKFGKVWEAKFAESCGDRLSLITCAPPQGRQKFDAVVRDLRRCGLDIIVRSLPAVSTS